MAKDIVVAVAVERVSVEQIIKPHIDRLRRREKMTVVDIAGAAGMPASNIHAILRQKFVTPDVAARILAVTAADKQPGHDVPIHMSAADTQARIIWLEGQGMSVPALAERCGVARGDLYRLKNGKRKYVTPEVRRRIFAVELEVIEPTLEPADETCRILQKLMMRQYSMADVSAATGLHDATLGAILNMRHPNAEVATAQAVREFWREHEKVLGPSPEAARDAELRGYPITPSKMRWEMEYIRARGARGYLQYLAERQYGLDVISAETLIGRDELAEIRDGRAKQIRRYKAKRIRRFYFEHKDVLGPSPNAASLAGKRTYPRSHTRWVTEGDWIDAAAMRRELDELSLQQWSPWAVAKACGSNGSTFDKILLGRQAAVLASTALAVHEFYIGHIGILGPSKEARQWAEKRAARPANARRSYISARAARLLLQELALRYFDLETVATGTGLSPQVISAIRKGTKERIVWATQTKILVYFAEVEGKRGESEGAWRHALDNGYLPVWRSSPRLAMQTPGAMLQTEPMGQRELLALERWAEQGVRRWLVSYTAQVLHGNKSSWEGSMLYRRFNLGTNGFIVTRSIGEYARVRGITEAMVRKLTRDHLQRLLQDPTVAVGNEFELALRVYMIHPGLAGLT